MLRDLLQESYTALRYNRRRTMLTMLGMAWGIATVVILLAFGSGFERAISLIFSSWGVDVIGAFPGRILQWRVLSLIVARIVTNSVNPQEEFEWPSPCRKCPESSVSMGFACPIPTQK